MVTLSADRFCFGTGTVGVLLRRTELTLTHEPPVVTGIIIANIESTVIRACDTQPNSREGRTAAEALVLLL